MHESTAFEYRDENTPLFERLLKPEMREEFCATGRTNSRSMSLTNPPLIFAGKPAQKTCDRFSPVTSISLLHALSN